MIPTYGISMTDTKMEVDEGHCESPKESIIRDIDSDSDSIAPAEHNNKHDNIEEWTDELQHSLFGITGPFAASNLLPESIESTFRLNVSGIGNISIHQHIPIPVIKTLLERASLAPFGKGNRTIHDSKVRHTYQIDSTQFTIDNEWIHSLQTHIFADLNERFHLSMQDVSELVLSPYKLLIYPTGSHFSSHRDSSKEDGMFGTFVLILPSHYDGGVLLIEQGKCAKSFDFADDIRRDGRMRWIAFFADCEHELKTVTEGYRMVIVFNMIRRQQTKDAPAVATSTLSHSAVNSMNQIRTRKVPDAIAHWLREDPSEPIAIALRHMYSESDLTQKCIKLKGDDLALQELLLAAVTGRQIANPPNDFHVVAAAEPAVAASSSSSSTPSVPQSRPLSVLVVPALLNVSERGYFEDETYARGRQVEDRRIYASNFPKDSPLSVWLGDSSKIAIRSSHLARPPDFDEQRLFDEKIEHTGNEGTNFERSYQYGAIILCSIDHRWQMITKKSLTRAFHLFRSSIRSMTTSSVAMSSSGVPAKGLPPMELPDLLDLSQAISTQLFTTQDIPVPWYDGFNKEGIKRHTMTDAIKFARDLLALYCVLAPSETESSLHHIRHSLRMITKKTWFSDLSDLRPIDTGEVIEFFSEMMVTEGYGEEAVREWMSSWCNQMLILRDFGATARHFTFYRMHSTDLFVEGVTSFFNRLIDSLQSRETVSDVRDTLARIIESAALRTLVAALVYPPLESSVDVPLTGSPLPRASRSERINPDAPALVNSIGQPFPVSPSVDSFQDISRESALMTLVCLVHVAVDWSEVKPVVLSLKDAIVRYVSVGRNDSATSTTPSPTASTKTMHVDDTKFLQEKLVPGLVKIYQDVSSFTTSQDEHMTWVRPMHEITVKALIERIEPLPEVGREWTYSEAVVNAIKARKSYTTCESSCEDCSNFFRFLRSNDREYRLRAAERQRRHISDYVGHVQSASPSLQYVDRVRSDEVLVGSTMTTGSPHTLIVRKNKSALRLTHEANKRTASLLASLHVAWPFDEPIPDTDVNITVTPRDTSAESAVSYIDGQYFLPYLINGAEARILQVEQWATLTSPEPVAKTTKAVKRGTSSSATSSKKVKR